MPSPLTSPAPATEKPLQSSASIPSRRKPFDAVERGEIEARREAGVGAEDDVALAGVVVRPPARRAPTIRSSMPSPLTSPAPATEMPLSSYASIPSRRKPFAAVERGEIEARREAGVGAEDDVALAGVVVRRDRRRRPDDQVVDAVAVDVARARDREAAAVVRVDPVEAEAVRSVERGEIEARREAGVGAEDDVALAGVVLPSGSAPGAPTIRSSMPSPLTSPAPATEQPL